jgi:hypothetical protein
MVSEGSKVRITSQGMFNGEKGWVDDEDYSENEVLIELEGKNEDVETGEKQAFKEWEFETV